MRSKIHSITSFYGTRVRAASGVGTALDFRFMVVMTAMHSVRSGQDGASGLCVAEVLINAVQLFTPTYLCVANVGEYRQLLSPPCILSLLLTQFSYPCFTYSVPIVLFPLPAILQN